MPDLFTLPEIQEQCIRIRRRFILMGSISALLVVVKDKVWFEVTDWNTEYIRRSALWVNHDGCSLKVSINIADLAYGTEEYIKNTLRRHTSTLVELSLSTVPVPKHFRFAMNRKQPKKKKG